MNPNENRHALGRVVNAVLHTGAQLSMAVAELLKREGIPLANPDDELTALPLRLSVAEDKRIDFCSQSDKPEAAPYLEQAGELTLAIHTALAHALENSILGRRHKLVLRQLVVGFGLQGGKLVVTESFNLNALDIAPRNGPRFRDEKILTQVFQPRTSRKRAA